MRHYIEIRIAQHGVELRPSVERLGSQCHRDPAYQLSGAVNKAIAAQTYLPRNPLLICVFQLGFIPAPSIPLVVLWGGRIS